MYDIYILYNNLSYTIFTYNFFYLSIYLSYIKSAAANFTDYKSSFPIRTKRLDLTCLCFSTLHCFNINTLRVVTHTE